MKKYVCIFGLLHCVYQFYILLKIQWMFKKPENWLWCSMVNHNNIWPLWIGDVERTDWCEMGRIRHWELIQGWHWSNHWRKLHFLADGSFFIPFFIHGFSWELLTLYLYLNICIDDFSNIPYINIFMARPLTVWLSISP